MRKDNERLGETKLKWNEGEGGREGCQQATNYKHSKGLLELKVYGGVLNLT